MEKTFSTNSNQTPTAHIAVNKNRLKGYSSGSGQPLSYYLTDKTEFQIELFNPTRYTYKCVISVNGSNISNSGIVIKPGQRIYLDRFIDKPVKFRFDTYEIDSNDDAAMRAIENNGGISVMFYREIEKTYPTNYFPLYNDITPYWCTLEQSVTNNVNTSDWRGYLETKLNSTRYSSTEPEMANLSCYVHNSFETGRIETGGNSTQSFSNYYGDFNFCHDTIVNIKLLPASTKPETSESIKRRIYCTNCGSKAKPSDRFCSHCGHKI